MKPRTDDQDPRPGRDSWSDRYAAALIAAAVAKALAEASPGDVQLAEVARTAAAVPKEIATAATRDLLFMLNRADDDCRDLLHKALAGVATKLFDGLANEFRNTLVEYGEAIVRLELRRRA